jgi:hypothetical protein
MYVHHLGHALRTGATEQTYFSCLTHHVISHVIIIGLVDAGCKLANRLGKMHVDGMC